MAASSEAKSNMGEHNASSSSSCSQCRRRRGIFDSARCGSDINRHRSTAMVRKLAAAKLNNIGAALIDRHAARGANRAIDILRDAVETLTARKDGLHGGYSFELAKAEACLSRADRRAGGEIKQNNKVEKAGRQSGNGTDKDGTSSLSSSWDCPFRCASSIEVALPATPTADDEILDDSEVGIIGVGGQGLLVVLLYNLALAHTIAGAQGGSEALIDKATSLYKMCENLLLQHAAEDPDGLLGVDVTYLARSIVNNMGMILFAWGRPDAGREYFNGLTSICFDLDEDCGGNQAYQRTGGRWNTFEINALIARGLNASSAA